MDASSVLKDGTGNGTQGGFDRLVGLASSIFDVPLVMISALEGDRAVFQANVPLPIDSLPSDQSVSRVVASLGEGGVLVIEDALADPRFRDHPMVARPGGVRFYAGATVRTADGRIAGAFSISDYKPRGRPDDRSLEQLRLLAGMAGDILDQRAANQRIGEQLGALRMAEQMSGVGQWRLDLKTQRVEWSDEVYRIHGVTPDRFDPSLDDAVGFYHPDDREAVRQAVAGVIETGRPYDFKLRLVRADGQERIVVSRGALEAGADGAPLAVYGVFQDVTEAETAHARIVESEARFRLLSDRATDIIVTYGVDGRISYISPSIETFTGRSPESLIGRPVTDLILAEDIPALAASFREMVKSGEPRPQGVRYRGVNQSNGDRWFEARTTLIRDADGRVTGFHDVVRDITETKRLEDELIAARDSAEQAARTKSEFLANMSHELRTPLTSVIGFSGLLQASAHLPEAERRHVDRIATASDALLSVINDILDYSKLEAEAVDLDPRPFDPQEMAEAAAGIVETQCRTKGLRLAVSVDDGLPQALMGDEGRLRQVLLNFLSNAVKFTISGEIRLDVTRAGERLRVAVTDSGIGIAPDKVAALFQRFTQADASTTRVYGGTGLGLAISRRLIEMMGGEIGVDSRAGEGSTFWFEVPMIAAELVSQDNRSDETVSLEGVRILMADDAPANRELVRLILESQGVDMDVVANGAEAVQAAGGGDYDLILMDVHMPVMDGMDATRALRGQGLTTPILALTANVQPEQVEACREAGMDAHIGKPIQVPELLAAIARHIGAVSAGARKVA